MREIHMLHFSMLSGLFKQTRVGGWHHAAVSHFNPATEICNVHTQTYSSSAPQ